MPKFLKSVKNIHYYSLLFIRVRSEESSSSIYAAFEGGPCSRGGGAGAGPAGTCAETPHDERQTDSASFRVSFVSSPDCRNFKNRRLRNDCVRAFINFRIVFHVPEICLHFTKVHLKLAKSHKIWQMSRQLTARPR